MFHFMFCKTNTILSDLYIKHGHELTVQMNNQDWYNVQLLVVRKKNTFGTESIGLVDISIFSKCDEYVSTWGILC